MPADVLLGFISELKEEKNCKTVLIFNEGELGDKSDDYEKYKEKVIDIEVQYAPTPSEAVDLALPADLPYRDTVALYSQRLKINNIRVLRRTARLHRIVATQLSDVHQRTLESIIQSLVLLVWCRYSNAPDRPSIAFLRGWNSMNWLFATAKDDAEIPSEEKDWAQLLSEYQYDVYAEIDNCIEQVIQAGYVEGAALRDAIAAYDQRIRSESYQGQFREAWSLFHNSFADNEGEFVRKLISAANAAIMGLTPIDVDGTVRVLKDLGHKEEARTLLADYVKKHSEDTDTLDLSQNPFASQIQDEEVREKIEAEYEKHRKLPPLSEALAQIASGQGWSGPHEQAINAATKDDVYRVLVEHRFDNLSAVVGRCMGFDEELREKTLYALRKIGESNRLNKLRVSKYNIPEK